MTNSLLIAAIIIVVLLLGILMWPAGASQGSKGTAQSGGLLSSIVVRADPYDNSAQFHSAWLEYLKGESDNSARIISTAATHQDWVRQIFPENAKNFHDGIRLNLGKYRIIYPYLSGEVINDYDILLTEVSNNKIDFVTTLIKCGANPNKKLIITAAISPEMIDLLVRAGADPNFPRFDGSSPLEYFKQLGRVDLIDAMIRNGAR